MSTRMRRSRGVAAASMATVSLFPFCAASAADVEVSIKNHTPQDVIEGPNVAIEADFKSSTGHNIQRVEFLVDGQVVESKALDQPALQGTFIFAWDTTQITNDVHTVTTRAYDEQNHIGTSNLQLFVDNQKVDKAEPMLRITVPREGAVVSGQFNIRVQGQQRSAAEPIPYVIVKLDNDIVGWFNGQSSASFRYDGTVLKDGPHKVQAATRTASNQEVLSPPIIVIVNKGGGDTVNYGQISPPIDPTIDPSTTGSTPNLVLPLPTPMKLQTPQPSPGNLTNPSSPDRNSNLAQANGAGIPSGQNATDPTFSPSTKNVGGQSSTSILPQGVSSQGSSSQGPTTHQTSSPATQPVMEALVPKESHTTVERHSNGWYASDDTAPKAQLDTRPAATAPAIAPGISALRVQDHAAAPQVMALVQPGSEQPVFFSPSTAPSTDLAGGVQPLKVAIGPHIHRGKGSTSGSISSGEMASIEPSIGAVVGSAPRPNSGLLRFGPPAIGSMTTTVPASRTMPRAARHSSALPKINPVSSEPISLIPAEQTEVVVVTVKHPTHRGRVAPRMAMRTQHTPNSGASDGTDGSPAFSAVIPPLTPNRANSKGTAVALQPAEDNSDRTFAQLKSGQKNTPEWLKLAYDNHVMNFDVPPRIVHNVTVTPFRALFEHAGGTVNWYPSTQTVTGQNRGKLILIRIGGKNAMINNQPVPLVLPAFIERGRTLVPVGFISQAMDLNVHINQRTGEIILTSKHVVAIATE